MRADQLTNKEISWWLMRQLLAVAMIAAVLLPVAAAGWLLVADALAVQVAHREYQERSLARDGLRRLYIGTLTLTLFLALFGAVLLAVLLGNQLVRPLLMLAAGMRDVARGDLGQIGRAHV